jgi:glycine/D-amino acid oxidase-like deaminating enzyme
MDSKVLVTPMQGRLRASSFMEFSGLESAADARKPAALRRKLKALGYRCDADGASWRGARPILPDYLPGIGRAPGEQNVFYAIGHQHIGLTMAPVTAQLIADLVAARTPRHDVAAFDLRRFGAPRKTQES